MIDFILGIIVGAILMRECFALRTKVGNTRLMLHVIWTRETMTIEQIADGLRKTDQLSYTALYFCLWRMLSRGEMEFCSRTDTYRLKGGSWDQL